MHARERGARDSPAARGSRGTGDCTVELGAHRGTRGCSGELGAHREPGGCTGELGAQPPLQGRRSRSQGRVPIPEASRTTVPCTKEPRNLDFGLLAAGKGGSLG